MCIREGSAREVPKSKQSKQGQSGRGRPRAGDKVEKADSQAPRNQEAATMFGCKEQKLRKAIPSEEGLIKRISKDLRRPIQTSGLPLRMEAAMFSSHPLFGLL